MAEAKMRRIYIRSGDGADDLDTVKSFADLYAWVKKMEDEVPLEYRDAVSIDIYEGDHGFPSMYVRYERPETPEDIEKDKQAEEHFRLAQQERERQLYLQLKEKYER